MELVEKINLAAKWIAESERLVSNKNARAKKNTLMNKRDIY